jgi:hypothetical protein
MSPREQPYRAEPMPLLKNAHARRGEVVLRYSLRSRWNSLESRMTTILDYPLLLLFPISFAALAFATWIGRRLANRSTIARESPEDFSVIQTGTLTLLGLIIGFTFSMAVSRYDQRKNLEEEEANAIGTAYLRADFVGEPYTARLRDVLKRYTTERLGYYTTRNGAELDAINARVAKLQNDMWAVVREGAMAHPDPLRSLAVASINDVVNSQGYTQAAWWNRIPHGAWILMALLAICANFLVGLGATGTQAPLRLTIVFPLTIAAAFFLIADIDAPRGGAIRVAPMNLQALIESLR